VGAIEKGAAKAELEAVRASERMASGQSQELMSTMIQELEVGPEISTVLGKNVPKLEIIVSGAPVSNSNHTEEDRVREAGRNTARVLRNVSATLVKTAAETLMMGVRSAFPPQHPSYDVQVTGMKAATEATQKKEAGKPTCGADLAKAVATALKHIEATTLDRVNLVRLKKESVKAATKPIADKVVGFPEVKLHVALHGITRVASEMDFKKVAETAGKAGAATMVRVGDLIANTCQIKAVDVLRQAGLVCEVCTKDCPASELNKLNCLKAWSALQPGNRPAVDFQVTGVHAAMKEAGKAAAPKLNQALKSALGKAADLIREKTEKVKSGKTDVAVLGKKTEEEVTGFKQVHIHVAVHGVSKVKTEEDAKGIFDALDRALDSTNTKVTSVLEEAPAAEVKRLR
jgi:hypothetical protein